MCCQMSCLLQILGILGSLVECHHRGGQCDGGLRIGVLQNIAATSRGEPYQCEVVIVGFGSSPGHLHIPRMVVIAGSQCQTAYRHSASSGVEDRYTTSLSVYVVAPGALFLPSGYKGIGQLLHTCLPFGSYLVALTLSLE